MHKEDVLKRINDLEKKYVLEALSNEFSTSKNGIFNSRLENKFCEKFNVEYAINHVNGTATMHSALNALGVKEGDEVIVPPLTMASTSLVVLQSRAVPVFADVDIKTFTLDPISVEKCITKKTKAMIPVSLYGLAPDYDELLKICSKYKFAMIEDNAQCFLGEYKGKLVGQFGDFASYSFQASKHMTCGDGGILTTNNQELANKARQFSSLGYSTISAKKGKIDKNDIQDPKFNRHVTLGYNYRMSEVNAAVALGQLEKLEDLVENRIKAAKMFNEAVKNHKNFIAQDEPEGYKNSYWTFSFYLKTDRPEKDWYDFRKLFLKNGGDGYYAAWKLNYMESLYQNIKKENKNIWQVYEQGLCINAEYLQPRLMQFKTNYWELSEAEKQAEILDKSIKEFNG